MTIHEQAKAARALANELFKGPCDDAKAGEHAAGPCIERHRTKRQTRGLGTMFADYDVGVFCAPCRTYWYAEMAAQTLERTAKLTPRADAEAPLPKGNFVPKEEG